MTATSHALTGAAIGLAVGHPLLAIPLAFLSHFVMDAIPHFDFAAAGKDVLTRNKDRTFLLIVAIDSTVTAGVFASMPLILDGSSLWLAWAGGLAAITPDLIWGWRFAGEIRHRVVKPMGRFSRFHKWVQWKESPRGLAVEISWIIFMAMAVGYLSVGK